MRRARYRARVPLLLLALLLLAVVPASAQPTAMGTEVVAVYPHDARAFTQGLLLHDGALFESTGLVGRSSVRQVELTTGKVLRQKDLPPPLFGEGLAWANDELVQLTWQNHRALRWVPATFESRGEWSYDGEGWGLCFDGKTLVQSDGSHRLFFRDPKTFAVQRTLAVANKGPGVQPHAGQFPGCDRGTLAAEAPDDFHFDARGGTVFEQAKHGRIGDRRIVNQQFFFRLAEKRSELLAGVGRGVPGGLKAVREDLLEEDGQREDRHEARHQSDRDRPLHMRPVLPPRPRLQPTQAHIHDHRHRTE